MSPSSLLTNQAPYHLIFNFFLSYVLIASRPLKLYYKIDHNVSPRTDLAKYGDRYVKDGKLTPSQLDLLKRNEACHANSMEHFPVFASAVIFATVAGVGAGTINSACWAYDVSRVIYAIAYLGGGAGKKGLMISYVRSIAWWTSSWCCLLLLWWSGQAMPTKDESTIG